MPVPERSGAGGRDTEELHAIMEPHTKNKSFSRRGCEGGDSAVVPGHSSKYKAGKHLKSHSLAVGPRGGEPGVRATDVGCQQGQTGNDLHGDHGMTLTRKKTDSTTEHHSQEGLARS